MRRWPFPPCGLEYSGSLGLVATHPSPKGKMRGIPYQAIVKIGPDDDSGARSEQTGL